MRKVLIMSVASTFIIGSGEHACKANTQTAPNKAITLYAGQQTRLIMPERVLADGAVRVESRQAGRSFTDWTYAENAEAYEILQHVAAQWAKKGINDYIVMGKVDGDNSFGWEIVPYTKGQKFLKQMAVAFRVFFGGKIASEAIRKSVMDDYKNANEIFTASLESPLEPKAPVQKSNDAFCTPKIVDSQKIIDDPEKDVRVLYDYKPLTKHHFLVVSKEHYESYSEMPFKAYMQGVKYAKMLFEKYGKKDSTAYLYHKTGKLAGQTVPHWHMHVVITETKNQNRWGILKVLFNTVWGVSPLKPAVQAERVKAYREQLSEKSHTQPLLTQ